MLTLVVVQKLTSLVLELIADQNTVGFQRFAPFQVDSIEILPVYGE